jgi:hypothetical protein
LQIRTHFARPNWRKVFSDLASAHKNSRIGEQPSRFGQHISTQGQQLICSYIQVFSIVDLQRSQNSSRIFRKNSARQPRLGSISTKKTSKIMYNSKFSNRLQIYLYRNEYDSIGITDLALQVLFLAGLYKVCVDGSMSPSYVDSEILTDMGYILEK